MKDHPTRGSRSLVFVDNGIQHARLNDRKGKMTWQDWVVTVGQFVFFLALLPTIKGVNKPAVSTGFVTAITMTVYIPTLWSLKLYGSVLPTLLGTIAWWVITYQSWRKSR